MGALEIIIVFILVIVLLVVTHELGHFLVARLFGIRVDEFGIGMPPRLFSYKGKETLYTFNALPLGGFVKIFGEEEDIHDPRSFSSKNYIIKSLVVVAGVLANIIMAFIIFTFIAWQGTAVFSTTLESVNTGSPAWEAGLKAGDKIVGLGGSKDDITVTDIQSYVSVNIGNTANFQVKRDEEKLDFEIVPRSNPPEGEGSLGIIFGSELVKTPFYKAPFHGAKATWLALLTIIVGLASFFSQLFTSGAAPTDLVGPVGIAVIAAETYKVSILSFFNLLAFLSLNLAIINILPIPALDGGRLLFFAVEKISGKIIPARVAGIIHSTFFIILIALIIWISYRDFINIDQYFGLFG
jgi:regulator of sigma E protease